MSLFVEITLHSIPHHPGNQPSSYPSIHPTIFTKPMWREKNCVFMDHIVLIFIQHYYYVVFFCFSSYSSPYYIMYIMIIIHMYIWILSLIMNILTSCQTAPQNTHVSKSILSEKTGICGMYVISMTIMSIIISSRSKLIRINTSIHLLSHSSASAQCQSVSQPASPSSVMKLITFLSVFN